MKGAVFQTSAAMIEAKRGIGRAVPVDVVGDQPRLHEQPVRSRHAGRQNSQPNILEVTTVGMAQGISMAAHGAAAAERLVSTSAMPRPSSVSRSGSKRL